MDGWMDGWMDGQGSRQMDRQKNRHVIGETDIWAHRWTGRQKVGQSFKVLCYNSLYSPEKIFSTNAARTKGEALSNYKGPVLFHQVFIVLNFHCNSHNTSFSL